MSDMPADAKKVLQEARERYTPGQRDRERVRHALDSAIAAGAVSSAASARAASQGAGTAAAGSSAPAAAGGGVGTPAALVMKVLVGVVATAATVGGLVMWQLERSPVKERAGSEEGGAPQTPSPAVDERSVRESASDSSPTSTRSIDTWDKPASEPLSRESDSAPSANDEAARAAGDRFPPSTAARRRPFDREPAASERKTALGREQKAGTDRYTPRAPEPSVRRTGAEEPTRGRSAPSGSNAALRSGLRDGSGARSRSGSGALPCESGNGADETGSATSAQGAEPVAEKSQPSAEQPAAAEPGEVSLESEIGLIRAASRALMNNEPESALRLLDHHAEQYPDGALSQERQALRVIALCELGEWSRGTREKDLFLQNAPDSPLADRVRKACRLAP